jgi:26S proteasome regulatory subunit T1
MSMDKDIRFELLSRLCPNSTGADLRSVCTEAGMFAIRARRKSISEKVFFPNKNLNFLKFR